MSPDGLRVLFSTQAALLPEGGLGWFGDYVDVYERSGGVTKLVSVGDAVGNPPDHSYGGRITRDGSRILFRSYERLVKNATT